MAASRPAMSLWDGDQLVAQFTEADGHKSREAKYGVWIKNNRVYKLFGKEDQANKAKTRTDQAIGAKVPTPAMTVRACTWVDKNKTSNKTWAGITDQLNGRKFQLSKGQLGMLEKEIQKAQDHNVWQETLNGVNAAVNFKLTDPQGFFNAGHNPPLSFIDIHYGSTAASDLNQLADYIKNLLKE